MRHLGILFLLPALALSAEPTSKDWYQAIRENNLAAIHSMASSKAAVNVTDSRGTTPLMQAATVGSLEATGHSGGSGHPREHGAGLPRPEPPFDNRIATK